MTSHCGSDNDDDDYVPEEPKPCRDYCQASGGCVVCDPKPEATALSDHCTRRQGPCVEFADGNCGHCKRRMSTDPRQCSHGVYNWRLCGECDGTKEAEVDRLRAENARQAETLKDYAELAYAIGYAHVADHCPIVPGPVELNIAEVKRLKRLETEQAETIAKLEAQLESNAEEADGFYAEAGKAKYDLEQLQNSTRKLVSACRTAERVLGVAAGLHSENSVYAAARDEVCEALKESQ